MQRRRGLVKPKGYDMYIQVFYAIAAIILLTLVLAAWLAVVLKKDDSSEGGWFGRCAAARGWAACVRLLPAWASTGLHGLAWGPHGACMGPHGRASAGMGPAWVCMGLHATACACMGSAWLVCASSAVACAHCFFTRTPCTHACAPCRLIQFLQMVSFLVYTLAWVTILDYLAFCELT